MGRTAKLRREQRGHVHAEHTDLHLVSEERKAQCILQKSSGINMYMRTRRIYLCISLIIGKASTEPFICEPKGFEGKARFTQGMYTEMTTYLPTSTHIPQGRALDTRYVHRDADKVIRITYSIVVRYTPQHLQAGVDK